MKHILLSILFSFAAALTCHGQMVMLQHNGKITATFSDDASTCLPKAFEQAEDGDTLFLSKGHYWNAPTINKSITIIGVGASECTLQNSLYGINITPEPNITISNINIEGVTITGQFYLGTSYSGEERKIENITVKKSNIGGIFTFNIEIENATFESCKISNTTCIQGHVKYLTFKNSEIDFLQSTFSTIALPKFLNCNIIKEVGTDALFVNCIIAIAGRNVTSYLGEGNILINTLYHRLPNYDPAQNCLVQDCYATEKEIGTYKDARDNELLITEEELQQNNYLGTDGTVVGKSGGARPFSLDMHLPSITKNNYTMDKNNKKVSMNVSVTAN